MAYWRAEMDEELVNSLRKATKIYPDNAKNVVIFIGDGMSIPTINAARIYKAQLEGNNFDTPETTFLTMERLEHMGHAKVIIGQQDWTFFLFFLTKKSTIFFFHRLTP